MTDRKDIVDTERLRAFEAIAKANSFTRAAHLLGIAQSSVSQQAARLKKRSGRLLVRRTTRRVELTPAAMMLVDYVIDRRPGCSDPAADAFADALRGVARQLAHSHGEATPGCSARVRFAGGAKDNPCAKGVRPSGRASAFSNRARVRASVATSRPA
jgi:Bacterial regulatory helix-turn-helix protein, lysR family